jgi:hypothetical protein
MLAATSSSSYTSPARSLCRSNKCTLVPKQHHQANLGELCSFPEPVPDVAASQHVQDMGGTAQNGCSKTAPHKLISRYQTKPLQWDSQGPVVSKSLECPQTSTRRSWVSKARAAQSSSCCQVTTTALCNHTLKTAPENRPCGIQCLCYGIGRAIL